MTGRSPSQLYGDLTARYGAPAYARIDTAATREQKAALAGSRPEQVTATELAGEKITEVLTTAPERRPIGGVKVVAESGWFAARPSGTEDVYKLYAESFRGPAHLAGSRTKHGGSWPQPSTAARGEERERRGISGSAL